MAEGRIQEPPFALPYESIIHGRYLIQEVLGLGGFGITYKGLDLKENRKIAVKEYYPNGNATRIPGSVKVEIHSAYGTYKRGMEKFLLEARIIYHYSIEHILRIYSLFEENFTAYYIMEYLEGRDLKQVLRENGGKLRWNELKKMVLPIMDALQIIHQDGIIHRDISPDNIYVCEGGSPKLIDFGTARNYMANSEMTVILKKGFAPPEQYLQNGRQGPWTDVYAMGATIYRCLTGQLPPEAPDRQRNDLLVSPEKLGSDAPVKVNRALMRALALGEYDRFRTMYEFRNELESAGEIGITSMAEVFTGFADRFLSRSISVRGGVKRIIGGSGVYAGQTINVEGDMVFGRDTSCAILFPKSSAGVSRIHCQIILDKNSGEAILIDCGSTYGTFLNGVRLQPGIPARLENGSIFSFGQDNSFRFETL